MDGDDRQRVEIELTGAPSSARRRVESPARSRRPGRTAAALAIAGAVAVAFAVPAVVLTTNDESAPTETTSTTAQVEQVTSVPVTVPPTLAPLNTTSREPPAPLALPSYPIADDRRSPTAAFDVDAAIERLDRDLPRRITTTYFGGQGRVERWGFDLTRDVTNDRFELVVRSPGTIAHSFVFDLAGGTTYQSINAQDTSWFGMSNDDMEAGMGRELVELIDTYVHGPFDPAWLTTELVEAGPLVRLPAGGGVARQYALTVDPDRAAGLHENRAARGGPPDIPLELRLYVTESNELVRVEGSVHDGDEWLLVSHLIEEVPADDAVVELPDPSLVSGN